jgi:hypothetical protein
LMSVLPRPAFEYTLQFVVLRWIIIVLFLAIDCIQRFPMVSNFSCVCYYYERVKLYSLVFDVMKRRACLCVP